MITTWLFAAQTACQQATGLDCGLGIPHAGANRGNIRSALSVVFAIFGALAVLMIVIGALNFVNSEGDPQKAASARGTMIYALVGLVVAVSAEVVVSVVLGQF